MSAPLIEHAPTQNELARLYHELAKIGATSVGERKAWRHAPQSREELIVLASQMMRYDPRLLSLLVQWLRASFDTLHPLQLRRVMSRTRWPQSLLVALRPPVDPDLPQLVAELDAFCQRWRPRAPSAVQSVEDVDEREELLAYLGTQPEGCRTLRAKRWAQYVQQLENTPVAARRPMKPRAASGQRVQL